MPNLPDAVPRSLPVSVPLTVVGSVTVRLHPGEDGAGHGRKDAARPAAGVLG
jgi:hypothetical protein